MEQPLHEPDQLLAFDQLFRLQSYGQTTQSEVTHVTVYGHYVVSLLTLLLTQVHQCHVPYLTSTLMVQQTSKQ